MKTNSPKQLIHLAKLALLRGKGFSNSQIWSKYNSTKITDLIGANSGETLMLWKKILDLTEYQAKIALLGIILNIEGGGHISLRKKVELNKN